MEWEIGHFSISDLQNSQYEMNGNYSPFLIHLHNSKYETGIIYLSFPISILVQEKWKIILFSVSHCEFCISEMEKLPILIIVFPISRTHFDFTLLCRSTAIAKIAMVNGANYVNSKFLMYINRNVKWVWFPLPILNCANEKWNCLTNFLFCIRQIGNWINGITPDYYGILYTK